MSGTAIVYIGGFELPDRNAAAHRVLTNAKILRELGFRVVLVGVRKSQTRDVDQGVCDGFVTYSLKYPASTLEWLARYFKVGQYERILKDIGPDKISAIVLYNEKSFLQCKVREWAKARGVRVIADVTEWHAHKGWGPSSLFKKLDVAVRMRILHRLADGLITTSTYITNHYVARGVRRDRIVELPTLFDTHTAAGLLMDNSNGDGDRPLTLTYSGTPFNVGQRTTRPGSLKERLDWTIELFLRLRTARPETSLAIFGVTREEFLRHYPTYERRTAECGPALRFHGRVPNRTVVQEVAKSDFTVFFRENNRVTRSGFPTKFSESITYGTPVITNLSPGIEKYAVPGQNCFLVDPENTSQLQEFVDFVAALQPQQIAKLKRACFESRLFDYRAYMPSMRKFLEAVGV